MANGTTRTKEKEVRTAEIEQAAREVFLSRGYQAATIQEIADKAGVAKGTVYLYYKGKDDLYSALILPTAEYLNERLMDLYEELGSGRYTTCEQFLNALTEVFVEQHYRDPEISMIYQGFQIGSIVTGVSEQILGRLTSLGKRNFQLLRDMCSNAIERKLMRDLDVVKTADALWGMFVGVVQVEWNKRKFSGKDHSRETLRHAFSVLCAGLSATAPELVRTPEPRRGRRRAVSAGGNER